ncbi:ester cyclase [Streptomyces tsukubensis]|uniref:ester cyclase n=1 Tax=Streptomyces tsukubensis TaxID=83656 RepID=UPI00344B4FED
MIREALHHITHRTQKDRTMSTTTPLTSLDGFHATPTAQRADELARSFVAAVNAQDHTAFDTLLSRTFLSYDIGGVRSRTAMKKYYAGLHASFSGLRFEVHENVGVLVENDLIALRTIVTGTHTGDYAGVPATGKAIQTSVSHVFRFRDDRLVEHWQVMDTYRILAGIGRVPGVAAQFQQLLGVPQSPDGVFVEKPGTAFDAPRSGRTVTGDESRAVGRRLYDGAITTGVAEDVDALAEEYIQNTGWTPDGRSYFGNAWAIGRGAMPDGLAVQTHVVAENDRVASISLWDGTIAAAGTPVDFASADFLRIEDGVAAEHWDTVDYVRLYQSFGLLPEDV